jgi:hypothetical protein
MKYEVYKNKNGSTLLPVESNIEELRKHEIANERYFAFSFDANTWEDATTIYYKWLNDKMKTISLNKGYKIAGHKWFEYQLDAFPGFGWDFGLGFHVSANRFTLNLAFLVIVFSWRTDHAGLDLTLNLPFVFANATIYDNRHWDDETNNWKEYGDNDE